MCWRRERSMTCKLNSPHHLCSFWGRIYLCSYLVVLCFVRNTKPQQIPGCFPGSRWEMNRPKNQKKLPIGISPKSSPWHCVCFQRSYIHWVLLTKLLSFLLFCHFSSQQEVSERADLHTPVLSLLLSHIPSLPLACDRWLRNYNYFFNVYLGRDLSPKYLKYYKNYVLLYLLQVEEVS